jgi:CRISPR/Cas system-associated endonuclease Cas1
MGGVAFERARITHESRDGSSKFVFDLMEPERPRVDRAVLDFVKATVSARSGPRGAG